MSVCLEMDHHESKVVDIFKALSELNASVKSRYPPSHQYVNDLDEKILGKITTYSLQELSKIDGKFVYFCFKLGLNKVSFDLLSRKGF